MSRELVTRWFTRLGVAEQGLPLLIYQGGVYSPRMAYDEVMRNSPLGDALQSLIEKQSFGTSAEDEQTVAKMRAKIWLSQKPDEPVFHTLSGKSFTPSQLLEEIQNGTDIGQQWLKSEISMMHRIVSTR